MSETAHGDRVQREPPDEHQGSRRLGAWELLHVEAPRREREAGSARLHDLHERQHDQARRRCRGRGSAGRIHYTATAEGEVWAIGYLKLSISSSSVGQVSAIEQSPESLPGHTQNEAPEPLTLSSHVVHAHSGDSQS